MRFLLTFMVLTAALAPFSAMAQVKIIPGQKEHPLLDNKTMPQTIEQYSNLYYTRCLGENKDPKMSEYTELQCACTASRMPAVLTLEEMQKLFDPNNKDDYYYSRLMTLGYAPCLDDTVHNFVFDDCLVSPAFQKIPSRKKLATCQCIGDYMGGHVPQSAVAQMPGASGYKFDLTKTVLNPLPYILGSENFQNISRYPAKSCIQQKVKGW